MTLISAPAVESNTELQAPRRRRRGGKGKGRFKPAETLILLDWDDTILPTSFLNAQRWTVEAELEPTALAVLDAYAQTAALVLAELQRLGRVVIVTNAEKGWVELTCQKFLPRLIQSVASCELVSARSTYEPFGISNPVEWKERTFTCLAELSRKVGDMRTRNVISIGDSFHERDALLLLGRSLHEKKQRVRCKSLKLLEKPDVLRLTMQHQFTLATLAQVVQLDAGLDLFVHAAGTTMPTCAAELRLACGNGEPFLPMVEP